jgi:putative transposase
MPFAYDNPGDYRRGRHVVSALRVHLVFMTKYWPGILDMLRRCKDAMRKIGDASVSSTGYDHVHLLVACPPKMAVAGLVNPPRNVPTWRLR